MSTTEMKRLTDQALTMLSGMGVSEGVTTDGAVISGSDRWGDQWTALVCADVAAVELAELDTHKGIDGRFVLVVAKAAESDGRAKLAEAGFEFKPGPNSVLVWAL